ncbi:tachykinin-4 [Ictalurus furcatus]|uniref:tachykinin-4 n=1 Tax=Ictalurus furcatus TaxID=66913 RepID=UPI00234FD873|nr:tachykinin-4 [Ictalurus furcatus]
MDIWSQENWQGDPAEIGFTLYFDDLLKHSKSQQFHGLMGRSLGNNGEMFVGLMGKRSSKGGKYFILHMKSVSDSLSESKYRLKLGKHNCSIA